MADPPFDPAVQERATLSLVAVAVNPVGAAGAVALIVIVNDLEFPAYKVVSVGVNVAVIVEDPAPTSSILAPPVTAATVVDAVFELV